MDSSQDGIGQHLSRELSTTCGVNVTYFELFDGQECVLHDSRCLSHDIFGTTVYPYIFILKYLIFLGNFLQ